RARVPALEPANVSRPPRDPRYPDVEAGGDLRGECVEGRVDVTGPNRGSVLLAPGPRGPAKGHDLFFPARPEPLSEAASVFSRVDVMYFGPWADVKQVALRILREHLGFAGIEPKRADPVPAVPLSDLFPHIAACFGFGRVVEPYEDRAIAALVPERHVQREGAYVADQQPATVHFAI